MPTAIRQDRRNIPPDSSSFKHPDVRYLTSGGVGIPIDGPADETSPHRGSDIEQAIPETHNPGAVRTDTCASE